MPKIIDLLKEKKEGDPPFTSLEFFPPRTKEGVKNLYSRLDRMKTNVKPLFTDVTWGAGGSTADLSLEIALQAQKTGHVANMHLTCTNLPGENPKDSVRSALQSALDGGITNIVALRGDPPHGQDEWKATSDDFTCALDLVKFIRSEFQDTFGIAVAGYPEGHPNAISQIDDVTTLTPSEKARSSNFDGITYACKDDDYKKEMDYLKEKIDAGADLIITQMFFDVDVFLQFVDDCRSHGITCPIVPGLMCINAYPGFMKMTKFCKTRVPPTLFGKMDALKDDANAIKSFGMEYGAQVCQTLIDSGKVDALHFYTLNLEKVVYGILDKLYDSNLLGKTQESDAKSMVAVGSAWARVGDTVKTIYGTGKVLEVAADSGTAKITITSWELAGGQNPTAFLQKGMYEKVF